MSTEIKIDLKFLVKDYDAQCKKTMKWNGWDFSEAGEKKKKKYDDAWREWDNQKIKELNLQEYLGEELNELIFCLDNNHGLHGGVFFALVNETDNGFELCAKEETIETIRNWKYEIEFKKISYYCDFRFKTKIKECFYAGAFLRHNKKMSADEALELVSEIQDSQEGFMPALSKKIEELIGENNFISDYYEFGQEDFGLYWDIKKEIFNSFIDKLLSWIKYEELENYFLYYSVYDRDTKKWSQYDINKKQIDNF